MIFRSKTEEHTRKLDAKGRKSRMFGLTVVLLALCSIGVSFLVLMGVTPIVPSEKVVYIALGINGALVLLLIG